MNKIVDTEDARQYFIDCDLSYDDITEGEILALVLILNKELKRHRQENPRINLSLSKKIDIVKKTNGKIKGCYLYANGSYFTRREAISFNRDGFIGFAGWASSNNVEPFTS